MNQEIDYITILCGEFHDGYTPLTRAEFWKLYHKYDDSIQKLAESDEEKVQQLMKRRGAVAFSIEKLRQMGVRVVTFMDEDYPERLRTILNDFASPLFYAAGDSVLNKGKYTGYVGSRNIEEKDVSWTERMVRKNVQDGFGVVTGGAQGVDSFSMKYALDNGGNVILYLPDNMKEKLKEPEILKGIMNGRILTYSHISPLAPKSRYTFVAAAMERNKFIYAHSGSAVVVRSDLKKGGTWGGATEAMKHHWAVVYVRNDEQCPGNQELIKMGGVPLSEDGTVLNKETVRTAVENRDKQEIISETEDEPRQLSLFDVI